MALRSILREVVSKRHEFRIAASLEPAAFQVSPQCLLRFLPRVCGLFCQVHRLFSNDMLSLMNIRSTRSGQKFAVLFGVSNGKACWWRQLPHWTAACWECVRVTGASGVASRTGDLTAAVCDGERVAGLFVSVEVSRTASLSFWSLGMCGTPARCLSGTGNVGHAYFSVLRGFGVWASQSVVSVVCRFFMFITVAPQPFGNRIEWNSVQFLSENARHDEILASSCGGRSGSSSSRQVF